MAREDLPRIVPILDATGLFPAELLPDMAEPYLSGTQPHIWLVADTGTELHGFAYCEPERITDGTYNLLAIAVNPERQSAGVGRSLVAAVEQAVRDLNGRVLLVETSSLSEFERTRRFYDQLAFSREAVIRDFYSEGDDKVVFWKKL